MTEAEERCARAAYEMFRRVFNTGDLPWRALTEATKERWVVISKAAIESQNNS